MFHAFCLIAFSRDSFVSPLELSISSIKTSNLSPILSSVSCPGLENSFIEILLYGRERELKASRRILYWLCGTLHVEIETLGEIHNPLNLSNSKIRTIGYPIKDEYGTNIKLFEKLIFFPFLNSI